MKKNLVFLLLALFFVSCADKQPVQTSPVNFTIISPIIRINDAGFIHRYAYNTDIDVYSSGVSIAKIDIKPNQICLNRACDDEAVFNQKFFKDRHYNGLFADIVNKKAIFGGKNLVKTACGFKQNFSDIEYEICGDLSKFRDSKNKIKINIKELEG